MQVRLDHCSAPQGVQPASKSPCQLGHTELPLLPNNSLTINKLIHNNSPEATHTLCPLYPSGNGVG